MGNGEDYWKKQSSTSDGKSKVKILLLIIFTNLLTVYIFTRPSISRNLSDYSEHPSLNGDFSALIFDLNNTRARLDDSDARAAELQRLLTSVNSHLDSLLSEFRRRDRNPAADDGWREEAKLVLEPHELPLGRSPITGSSQLHLPIGASCSGDEEELNQFMTYEVGGDCPLDEALAQRLMLKGCEPLPRRRCRARSPAGYVEPIPPPASLWTLPPDTSVVWDAYACKSYQCLVDRINTPEITDCKDCFHLQGREKDRWLADTDGLDYSIDAILATKPRGTVRIGLDIGGGSGTFAARMKERDVTIITTTMNFNGPFNNFIASRGLIPIYITVSHRLPFFDNTLDLVHSMHVLSNWIPTIVLEFTLYDIYRVLRPGGLFWLDHFFCTGSELNQTYAPVINRIGFNKLRWNLGRKLDRGAHLNHWYLSALLEKPLT